MPTTAAIKMLVQNLFRNHPKFIPKSSKIHSEFIGPWYTVIVIAVHRGLREEKLGGNCNVGGEEHAGQRSAGQ